MPQTVRPQTWDRLTLRFSTWTIVRGSMRQRADRRAADGPGQAANQETAPASADVPALAAAPMTPRSGAPRGEGVFICGQPVRGEDHARKQNAESEIGPFQRDYCASAAITYDGIGGRAISIFALSQLVTSRHRSVLDVRFPVTACMNVRLFLAPAMVATLRLGLGTVSRIYLGGSFRLTGSLCVVGALLWLPGCARDASVTHAPARAAVTAKRPPPAQMARTVATRARPSPDHPMTASLGAPVNTEPLSPPDTPSPPAAPRAPTAVVGLSQDQVRGLLGAPAATAAHGAMQTWTYHSGACSLDIAFYYDVTRNGFFALSRHAAGTGAGGDDCLGRILDAHAS